MKIFVCVSLHALYNYNEQMVDVVIMPCLNVFKRIKSTFSSDLDNGQNSEITKVSTIFIGLRCDIL